MQETVLAFPAELMGIPVEQVPILDRREDVVDGAAYPTLVYFAEINGLPIVYSNTIASLPRRTVQVLTYAVGKNLTAAMTNIHSEFLAEVRIGGRP